MKISPTKIEVLTIPGDITYRLLGDFLEFRKQTSNLQDVVVICDCSLVRLIDPMGLCLLKHWFDELSARNVSIHLEQLRYAIESYMRRMDLFRNCPYVVFLNHTSIDPDSRIEKVVELRTLDHKQDVNGAASRLAAVIAAGMPGVSFEPDPAGMHASSGEQMEQTLEYVFSEIPYWQGTGVNFVFRKVDLLNVDRARIIRDLPDWKLVKEIRFG